MIKSGPVPGKHGHLEENSSGRPVFSAPEGSVELFDQHKEAFWIDADMLIWVEKKRYWTGDDEHLYIEVLPGVRAKKTVEMRLDRYLHEIDKQLSKTMSRVVHKNGNIRDCRNSNLTMLSGRKKESHNAA